MSARAKGLQADYLGSIFGLEGHAALVTGGSGGLGRSISSALGRAGARVVVNARDSGRCLETVRELVAIGVDASAAPFDVSDAAAVGSAEAALRAQGIHVDILVAAAGEQNRKPVTEMPVSEWQALLDVHVNGAFNCVRTFLPGMIARGRGRIILMSSIAAQECMPSISAYATAKGAIASFTRALAVEYGGRGITANALAPGFVRTAFTRALQESADFQKFLVAAVPAGRWADPDDIAPAVVYLASAAGSFVNGHVLALDGGMMAKM